MVGCTKDPCPPDLPKLTISRQPNPPLLLEMAHSVHSLSKTSIWQCVTARHARAQMTQLRDAAEKL